MKAIKKSKKSRKVGLTKERAVVIGIMSLVLLVVVTWMLYPIRNGKPENVARRFLKHNEKIKSEVGEITDFDGFREFGRDDFTARSRNIAERIHTGQKPLVVDNSNQTPQTRGVFDPSDAWQSGKVIGTNKTLDVKVHLRKYFWVDSTEVYYFTVVGATYMDETGNWNDIPIGSFENYLLLFK